MLDLDELKTVIRRNKLLGMWAADQLGLLGPDAEAYGDALAVGAIDPKPIDVFSKIRQDFEAAGVVQSDEQILRVMNEFLLQATNQTKAIGKGFADGACVSLARNLSKGAKT